MTVSSDTNRFATAASIPGHRFVATTFFSDKFATAAADERIAATGNIATDDRIAAAGNIAAGDRVTAAGDIATGDRVAAAGNIAAGDRVAAAGNIADGDRVAAAGDRVAAAAVVGTFFWFSFTSNE